MRESALKPNLDILVENYQRILMPLRVTVRGTSGFCESIESQTYQRPVLWSADMIR